MSALCHVAVGIVFNEHREVLVALRPVHLHQGGLWEFPGGKIETGETILQALARELREEIGIQVLTARPLIQLPYDYTDKKVLLDVYEITAYQGAPTGCEGQTIQWVAITDLPNLSVPKANQGIVKTILEVFSHYTNKVK